MGHICILKSLKEFANHFHLLPTIWEANDTSKAECCGPKYCLIMAILFLIRKKNLVYTLIFSQMTYSKVHGKGVCGQFWTIHFGVCQLRKDQYIVFFKKNGPTPASFTFIFIFSSTHFIFLQQINVKNVHPVYGTRIWTRDLWNMSLLP